jgi:hypothetical protein
MHTAICTNLGYRQFIGLMFMCFLGFTNAVGFMFCIMLTWYALGLCPWRASDIRAWPSVHWQIEAESVPCFGLPVRARFQLPQRRPTEPAALCHTREETKWEGECSHILPHSPSRRQLARGRASILFVTILLNVAVEVGNISTSSLSSEIICVFFLQPFNHMVG